MLRYRAAADALDQWRQELTLPAGVAPDERWERASMLIESFGRATKRHADELDQVGYWSLACGCDLMHGDLEGRCTWLHMEHPELGAHPPVAP